MADPENNVPPPTDPEENKGNEENKDDQTPDDPTVGSEQNDANWELKKILVPGYVLSRLVRDIENVLTINAALMSLPDLKLQNKSCELFNAAFKLLWTIQYHAKVRLHYYTFHPTARTSS